jgi:tricorn protease
LGLAALVAGSVFAGYLLHARRAADVLPGWKNLTLTLLTTDPGYEGEPTFSPDGQTIAYVADRDGNFEIYLQQISGGPAINLTHDPAADIQPAFSPDGREIAFVSDRAGGTEIFRSAPGLPHVGGDIWVMPTLGGPPRRIVEDGSFPSWTPDGTGIVYVHGSFRHTRIAIVPSTGGAAHDVPIEDVFVARYFFPRFSQDGRWLLYQNGIQIEVVSAQGGKAKTLAQGEYPAWGAGSTSIIYTNNLPGKGRTLWTAPFSPARGELTGLPRPLTFGRGADLGASVSRDGGVIAFSTVDETLNLEEVSFDAEGGRVLGTERELTTGNNRIRFFDTSPDGKAIVYDADRGAGSHLWRLDSPATPIELTHEPGFSDTSPMWSPDGRQIAFSRQPLGILGGPSDLWLMGADGASPRRVAEMSGAEFGVWMPDGKKILVPHGDVLLQLDLESGKTAPVPGVDARNLFILDRSGQWIVFQTAQSGGLCLSATPITGGAPRVVVDSSHEPFHPFFSPSGRWLYFQRNHKNIFRVPGPSQDWKSAPPEKVTEFSGNDLYIEDPKISRDGTNLFFTRGRTTGDIVILRTAGSSEQKAAR